MSISSTSASLSLHAVFLALLLSLPAARDPLVRAILSDRTPLLVPADLIRPKPTPDTPGTRGGGGLDMPQPATRGMLPRSPVRVFVPPAQVRTNEQPILELPPALDVPLDAPNIKAANWGDPFAVVGPPSHGRGRRGGIGDGSDGGIGNQRGNRYGTGLDGVLNVGGGVTAPRLLFKVEPEYSEEARKAKYQGAVTLRAIVDEHGAVRHVEVSAPLGLGLDEKAIEAVKKWRFQPGRQSGKPVPVWAVVEVHFRLL